MYQTIDVEGVVFMVDWGKFPVGAFIFIPCLDTAHVSKLVRDFARHRMGYKVKCTAGAYKGKWGVGVLRTQ
jgi:hypothetical protein